MKSKKFNWLGLFPVIWISMSVGIVIGFAVGEYVKEKELMSKRLDIFNYTITVCTGFSLENMECVDLTTPFNRVECKNTCFPDGSCYFVCSPVQLRNPTIFIQTNESYVRVEE